ncbi:MAG: hypothetical protein HYW22_01645 [Candidatus Aenigmarchaeota archaeon]|nr:hypothetical protein [Candidatus Aenigmarchaeota archaeon]
MVIELLFGIALLAVVAYTIFRVIGSVAIGVALVAAVFIASYLLTGALPELGTVPLVGNFLPKTGQAIAVIHNTVYSSEILSVAKSSNGNLLVTFVNTGQLHLSNFTAYVDGKPVDILNKKDSIKSGEITVFELDWKQPFENIIITSDQTRAVYEANPQ